MLTHSLGTTSNRSVCLGWISYWFILASLAIIDVLLHFSLDAIRLSRFTFEVLILIGLLSKIKEIPILNRVFWQGIAVLQGLILTCLAALCLALLSTDNQLNFNQWRVIALAILLLLPAQLVLWNYAFKSKDLWRSLNNKKLFTAFR